VAAVPRCLSEDNQTASIVRSLRKEHEGMYRCVAHGHNGEVISNEVELVTQGEIWFVVRRTGTQSCSLHYVMRNSALIQAYTIYCIQVQ